MKKIVGFGDSFLYGSEQKNNIKGSLGWPGRIAKNLGYEYHCNARPGCGNDYIAQQIYSWFSNNSAKDTLVVINWTWISRWDFYVLEHKSWITLGPTCVPVLLKEIASRTQAQDIIKFYNSRLNAGILWNKIRNLQTIFAAQSYLKQKNIKNIQTYMDYDMFDIDCKYTELTPGYVDELQKLVYPEMQLFEGQNFLDWSKKNKFTITDPGWHPMEDAHTSAAELWQDQYVSMLYR